MDDKLKEMLNRAVKLQAHIPPSRRVMGAKSGSQEKVYTFTESELRERDASMWHDGYITAYYDSENDALVHDEEGFITVKNNPHRNHNG